MNPPDLHQQMQTESETADRAARAAEFLDSPGYREFVKPFLADCRAGLVSEFQNLELSDERRFLLQALGLRAGLRMVEAFENRLQSYIARGREAALRLKEILKDIEFNQEQEE